jgi:propionyl-CoA carboxylase beta chain
MSAGDSTERLRRLKDEARFSGGPEQIVARRRRGAGSARDRVTRLLDANTFVELDVFVPGAVTGHGKVDGRDVYVFSQDGEVSSESLDEMFARKLAKIADLAMKNGAPLVGLYDGGRPRGGAGTGLLGAYAELYLRNVMASGVIPQIAAVMGPCPGGAAFSPALADFTIMVKGSSQVFLGGPGGSAGGVRGSLGGAGEEDTETAYEELGGARAHSEKSGLAHLAADDEAECLELIRMLLSYLPQNNLEEPPRTDLFDPADRREEGLEVFGALALGAPTVSSAAAGGAAAGDSGEDGPDGEEPETDPSRDVRAVVERVVDEGEFLEISPRWAKNVVVGFARLGGRPVGIVANQRAHLEGRLDGNGAAKAARFVRFCDAFNLPLVTFVDTPGFAGGKEQEHGGTVRAAAKLMYAFCEATVPKLTLVIRQACGEGYEVMGSKHTRADFNFAWPGAEIGAKAPEGVLDRQDSGSPYEAALHGYLDDIIEPAETRPRLIAALEACVSKREGRPPKKHGNIPL